MIKMLINTITQTYEVKPADSLSLLIRAIKCFFFYGAVGVFLYLRWDFWLISLMAVNLSFNLLMLLPLKAMGEPDAEIEPEPAQPDKTNTPKIIISAVITLTSFVLFIIFFKMLKNPVSNHTAGNFFMSFALIQLGLVLMNLVYNRVFLLIIGLFMPINIILWKLGIAHRTALVWMLFIEAFWGLILYTNQLKKVKSGNTVNIPHILDYI